MGKTMGSGFTVRKNTRGSSWRVVFLFVAMMAVVLNVADGLLTKLCVDKGLGIEANGLLAGVASSWWLAVLKGVVACLLMVWLYRRLRGNERGYHISSVVLGVLCIGFWVLVLWNGGILRLG